MNTFQRIAHTGLPSGDPLASGIRPLGAAGHHFDGSTEGRALTAEAARRLVHGARTNIGKCLSRYQSRPVGFKFAPLDRSGYRNTSIPLVLCRAGYRSESVIGAMCSGGFSKLEDPKANSRRRSIKPASGFFLAPHLFQQIGRGLFHCFHISRSPVSINPGEQFHVFSFPQIVRT